MSRTDLPYLLRFWGLEFSCERPDCQIGGSPERSLMRTVVCDTDCGTWVLEEIEEENLARKLEIAVCLCDLHQSGMKHIDPWKKTLETMFYQTAGGRYWMLRPFVEGVPLPRMSYLSELWRVEAMADFLLDLRKHSGHFSGPVFSITAYAEERFQMWSQRYPDLANKLERSFGKLKHRFFPVYDQLPVLFCHGDFHALNVVWGNETIRSVIDWEFFGIKPELYDAALLLGCFGFNDPDYLIGDPALCLIHRLRQAGFGTDLSWEWFLDLTAVIRYGWMSEWIRRSDTEAQGMETVYVDILTDQKEYILQRWADAL